MKVIAIGRNYAEHAKELNNPLPQEPVFFMKPDTALIKNNKPFFYPDFTTDLQYETEIVLRITRVGRDIRQKFAPRYYTEIGIGIDFTARDIQSRCKAKGLPWEVAKAFDGSAPISIFQPKDHFNDIFHLNFHLDINGHTVQVGNTGDMIFSYDQIVAHVSKYVTLKMGDLIFTGTPSGVGPVKIGDRLQAYVEEELLLDFYIR